MQFGDGLSPVWALVGIFGVVTTAAWLQVATALEKDGFKSARTNTKLRHAATGTAITLGLASFLLIVPPLALLF